MNELFRIANGAAELAESKAERAYNSLIIMIFAMMGLIIVMWAINAYWAKEINLILFFLGGILLLVMGFTPRVVGMSALTGLTVNSLQDKDMSQGTVAGIKVLYKVVTGILLGFWVVAGLLATWSFKEAPVTFWPVASMALVIGLVIEFFEMKGGIFKWVVIIYAVGVILVSFWHTFPQEWKSVLKESVHQETVSGTQITKSTTFVWGNRDKDGSIPTGKWSQWLDVGGCDTGMTVGNDFVAKAKLYSGEVVDMKRGVHVDGVKQISVKPIVGGKRSFRLNYLNC